MSLGGLGLQPEPIKRELRFLGERKGLLPTGLEPGNINAGTMISICHHMWPKKTQLREEMDTELRHG